jgi:membrane-anchored protein YejM (alkaline phosphatase superfamily)
VLSERALSFLNFFFIDALIPDRIPAIAEKVRDLRFFYRTGTWLVPRSFFYMILYVSIALASALLLPSGMREVGIILSAIGFTISLVDTVLFMRLIR